MISNNGNEQSGGGFSTGGLKSGDGKIGLWIVIGLAVLVVGGAVLKFWVLK